MVESVHLRNGKLKRLRAALPAPGGPSAVSSEWVRFLNSGCCQGNAQESMHPNAYAQQALGRCLTLIYAQPASTNWQCRNTRGRGPAGMYLSSAP